MPLYPALLGLPDEMGHYRLLKEKKKEELAQHQAEMKQKDVKKPTGDIQKAKIATVQPEFAPDEMAKHGALKAYTQMKYQSSDRYEMKTPPKLAIKFAEDKPAKKIDINKEKPKKPPIVMKYFQKSHQIVPAQSDNEIILKFLVYFLMVLICENYLLLVHHNIIVFHHVIIIYFIVAEMITNAALISAVFLCLCLDVSYGKIRPIATTTMVITLSSCIAKQILTISDHSLKYNHLESVADAVIHLFILSLQNALLAALKKLKNTGQKDNDSLDIETGECLEKSLLPLVDPSYKKNYLKIENCG